MSSSPADCYRARFRAVLEFIDAHADEVLDLDRLSSVASFSKFHFQRQFTALFGIGVFKYVQLTRLKRASYRLAFRGDASVLDVAHDCGYEGPEAFARAFKRTFGQSPSAFREEPDWSSWYATNDPLSELRSQHMNRLITNEQIAIMQFPGAKVATLEHRGDPRRIGDSIRKFIEWRKTSGLHPHTSATYNVLYDGAPCYASPAVTMRSRAARSSSIRSGYRTAARSCATSRFFYSASASFPVCRSTSKSWICSCRSRVETACNLRSCAHEGRNHFRHAWPDAP